MSAHSSHIEFEAPPSAITPAVEKRHYSIDLSLELERQLDAESLPPTPIPQPPQTSHHHLSMPLQMPDIDPHVLAHIISQLRHQLADMTKERDDLLALLSAAHTKEAELEDALQHITDKAMSLDDALSDARKKSKEDDEAISMLRTKVEESRYMHRISRLLLCANSGVQTRIDAHTSRESPTKRAARDSRHCPRKCAVCV